MTEQTCVQSHKMADVMFHKMAGDPQCPCGTNYGQGIIMTTVQCTDICSTKLPDRRISEGFKVVRT